MKKRIDPDFEDLEPINDLDGLYQAWLLEEIEINGKKNTKTLREQVKKKVLALGEIKNVKRELSKAFERFSEFKRLQAKHKKG